MDAVRSAWEKSIERHIKREFPSLKMETNNRRIIPSRNSNQYLEIDIFIPELRLGFELNGERFHNYQKYLEDSYHATEISDEMYKENYCKKKGILLIHIWSFEDTDAIYARINTIIQNRIADSSNKEWRSTTNIQPLKNVVDVIAIIAYFASIGLIAFCGLSIVLLIMLWLGGAPPFVDGFDWTNPDNIRFLFPVVGFGIGALLFHYLYNKYIL